MAERRRVRIEGVEPGRRREGRVTLVEILECPTTPIRSASIHHRASRE